MIHCRDESLQSNSLLDDALGVEELSDDLSGDFTTRQTQRWAANAFTNAAAEAGAESDMNPPETTPEEPQGVPGPRRGLTAILQEANFDWAQKPEDEVASDDEMDDWLNQFGPSEPHKPATETPDWLTDLEQPKEAAENDDDWLTEFEPDTAVPTGEFAVEAVEEQLGWMNDEQQADNSLEENDDNGDWLAEFAPEETKASASDDFTWMTDKSLTGSEEEAAADDVPDWLSRLEPEQAANKSQPVTTEAPAEAEDFVWMTDEAASLGDSVEEADAASAEVPDWLTELEPEQETDTPETSQVVVEPTMTDGEFSWLNEPEAEADLETKEEAEAASAEVPDWLTELKPEQETDTPAEPETAADDDFGWLDEPAAKTDLKTQMLAEPVSVEAVSETPDWLMELEPEGETPDAPAEPEPVAETPASDDDFGWLDESAAEAEPDLATEAETEAVSAETPDWLMELEPEAETPDGSRRARTVAETPASDDDFGWLDEPDAEAEPELATEEEAEAVSAETPDWLMELEPEAETPDAAAEPEPVAETPASDDDFGWLDEPAAEAEPDLATEAEAEAVSAETPDWLMGLEPEAETPDMPVEPETVAETPASDDDFGWLDEPAAEAEPDLETEEEAEAVSAEAPDWLMELEPEGETPDAPAEPETVAETPASDDDFGWLDEPAAEAEPDLETEEEAEAVSAEAPDWLMELEPEGETPDAPAEPEPVAETPASDDDFGWLDEPDAEVETEEESQTVSEEKVPEWLAEDEVAAVAEASDMDWLNESSDDDAFDAMSEISENEEEPVSVEADEVLEPTPANNAPDWLNAMVPGLDVDYEAADDLAAEEEPVEEPAATSKREYAWLVELVEKELTATESPSFAFSSRPTWLEPANSLVAGGAVEDDLPDWPSDDADADVPEWLR